MADLTRRAQVSQAANNRYLEALASVTGKKPLNQTIPGLTEPLTQEGRRYRGLRPWSREDGALLEWIRQGQWKIHGFRNRDLRRYLDASHGTRAQERTRSAAVTRKLRLLRAHGLIHKVSGTHRYKVSEKGRPLLTALLAARKADMDQLTKMAA